ncbi:hypothetical protein H2204_011439 [Knufia peltigerae]|uniref:Beta-lactamase-related domain-containing protein n=1 Tax=Knufia peltigerae TaxID=1002370 RepID=A0AA38XU88_9EURO|nr:hypothetical protein H2204_011439 [Knufia peltigerae]
MASSLTLALGAFLAIPSLSRAIPPMSGPLLPVPVLTTSSSFQDVAANLTMLLNDASSNSSMAGFAAENTSFSVAITSLSAPESDPVIWDYHHLAPERSRLSANSIDGDSQYLAASISKVFTTLLVLQSDIGLESSITDFFPELRHTNSSSPIPWCNVTVSHLVSHLSGIPQNYGFPEIYDLVPVYESLGFPPLKTSDFPPCGIIGLTEGCTERTLLSALSNPSTSSTSVFAPATYPAYSNLAFSLLGLILHRHSNTNTSFSTLLQNQILSPLNMTHSGVSPATESSNFIVPIANSSFNSSFGINAPASGLYTSANDLSRFLHSILSLSTTILPTAGLIHAWLQPHSFTSSISSAVGAPWEIYRVPFSTLLPFPSTAKGDSTTIDIYAKDGSVQAYNSRIALIPRYGLGLTFLTAGDTPFALRALSEVVVARVVAAAEVVAREQAENAYTGAYFSSADGFEANLTLSLDSGPGLIVEGFYRNGSDMLAAINGIFTQSVVGIGATLPNEFRIYPAGIVHSEVLSSGEDLEEEVVLEDWRLGIEPLSSESADGTMEKREGKAVFRDADASWLRVDGSLLYGGRSIDRVVIVKAVDGNVKGVRWPALRLELTKKGDNV